MTANKGTRFGCTNDGLQGQKSEKSAPEPVLQGSPLDDVQN